MIWFNQDRISQGRWPFLNAARASLAELERSQPSTLDLTEGSGDLLFTGSMRAYRHAVVTRVLDLAQAVVTAWNAGLLIGAIVCSRSLLETIAIFHAFVKRAEEAAAVKDWAKMGRLVDAYAFHTTAGSHKKAKARAPEAPPRVTDAVKEFIQATQPGEEQFWEKICDTAHPNGQRIMGDAWTLGETEYAARPLQDREPALFIAVFNALHCCCWFGNAELDFDILLEVIRSGDELPSDHRLIADRNALDKLTADVLARVQPVKVGPQRPKT